MKNRSSNQRRLNEAYAKAQLQERRYMSEHNEQVALFEALALHPECKWVFAIPNGFYSTPAQKNKMKREGLKKGVWDLCAPYPRGGYHGLFVEMKFGSNKLTPEQVEFGDFASSEGYLCRVAYDWLTAYNFILEYMGLEKHFE